MTNDGNCILRRSVSPAASPRSSRARAGRGGGDGTTSVIVLAARCSVARPFIDRNMHPTVVCRAYNEALQFAHPSVVRKMAIDVVEGEDDRLHVVRSCIGTNSCPASRTRWLTWP